LVPNKSCFATRQIVPLSSSGLWRGFLSNEAIAAANGRGCARGGIGSSPRTVFYIFDDAIVSPLSAGFNSSSAADEKGIWRYRPVPRAARRESHMAQDRNAADLRVSAESLRRFIAAAYRASGIPDADAQKAAELMAQSDISGADGHGVFRLPQYVRRIKAGGLNTRPEITVIRRAKAAALVDGDNGLGSLVVSRAVEEAISLARDNGVGWVGVRRGNHAGAAAVYAAMPLQHDMIGLYFAVGNANHLPPWGGADMLLSTNPIAVAVPALEEPPLILDMATTVAAYGKVKVAAQQGKTMPEGWMIDRQGQPLTDPNRADDGFLLPIGGYKGAALALMFGLLAGTLNGAANGADVVDFNKDDVTPTNTGQAICVLDIKAFAEPTQFKRQVDAVIRQLHGSALLPGFDHIRLPGEDRAQRIAEREAHGIPILPELRTALDKLATDLSIAPLLT
jgi:L-2-hydroxycarboxylate dehydrogenase (NAD+)